MDSALAGVGFVVVAALSTLGGTVVVAAAWYGIVRFGKEWDEWRKERRAIEAVEDIVREGPGR
jgi:hypothetical protein